MTDQVFNIAKGRVAELHNKVQTNEVAASQLVIIAIVSTDTDDLIRDVDDIAALLVLGNTAEATNGGYARIDLDDTDLDAIDNDDTNNRMDVNITVDPVFSSITGGDNWTHLVIAYDTTGSDTDANLLPLTIHDFVVTPNGGDITAQIAADGYFRAS